LIKQSAEAGGPMIDVAATPLSRPDRPEPDEHTWPHVLLLIDQFDRILGGGERVLLEIARHLPKHRFRASILTLSLHPDSPALTCPPCPIYLLPVGRILSFRGIRSSLALGRFLESKNIQIVQTFFASADLWGGFVTKAMSRAKLVWFLRDMGFQRNRKQQLAYRLISGFPDAIFAVSEQVRKQSITADRIGPTRIMTIHNGLSPENWGRRPRNPKGGDELHITTVGNVRRVKGHDLFIYAAAQIRSFFPQATFSIVGDVLEPDFHLELQRLSETLGLQDSLRFLSGNVDIAQHLAQSDIFVLASRTEGFPNVIIEAMASSLPVIATGVGGNSEAVKHGLTGLIVPPEDIAALKDAIVWMITNHSKAQTMGDIGRTIVINEFTTLQMMSKITRAYQSLLSKG
jgi:glycosyltransferase involved in cell wall biosynthesis